MITDTAVMTGVAPRHGVMPPLFPGVTRHGLGAPRVAQGGRPHDFPTHLSDFGAMHMVLGGSALLSRIEEAGLAGRGGAHFPVAMKWRTVLTQPGESLVVANAAEGEPWSAKDATLLQLRPHLVLDGLAVTARAVGSNETIIWISDEEVVSIGALVRALAERRAHGVDEPTPRIVRVPHHYLAGESSAVVRGLDSGVSLPGFQSVPAAVRGVSGRPTLVQNVDTLARTALIARGHAGRPRHLITVVTGRGRHVLDVAPGDSIGASVGVVRDGWGITGGPEPRPAAVLLGGFGGEWVNWNDAARMVVDEPAAREGGHSLGAGIVGVLPEGACGLRQTSDICRYLSAAGARQCGPCMFGLPEIAADMATLAGLGGSLRELARVESDIRMVHGRGACHHPDGVARLVASALRVFGPEISRHLHGSCSGAAAHLAVPDGVRR